MTRGLTTFLTRLIVGRLNDIALRHGKVKMITQFTFALFGILNFVCSFLRSFPLLLVYMALIGIVEGVWWVTYSLLAMEITGGYYFSQAFSLCNLIGAFTTLFGSPISGTVKTVKPVFHFNRIVSIFFCVEIISSTLVLRKQRNTIRFGTIWLKWKTTFKASFQLRIFHMHVHACKSLKRLDSTTAFSRRNAKNFARNKLPHAQ